MEPSDDAVSLEEQDSDPNPEKDSLGEEPLHPALKEEEEPEHHEKDSPEVEGEEERELLIPKERVHNIEEEKEDDKDVEASHPTARRRLPHSQRNKALQQEQRKSRVGREAASSTRSTRMTAILVSLFLLVLALIMLYLLLSQPEVVLQPYATALVKARCFPVSDADIINGTAYRKWDLRQLRASMLHYIHRDELAGISAMDLGIPLCYMVVRNNRGVLSERYNLNITGNSREKVESPERSHFCVHQVSVYVQRHHSIVFEYATPETLHFENMFVDGGEAATLQHLFGVEHGNTICGLYL